MSQFRLPLSRRKLIAGAAVTAAAAPLAGNLSLSPAAAKADMKEVDRPTHRRFKLGEFTITTINDGAVSMEDPQSIFGTNASKEEFEAQAKANFLPTDKLQISFTPVIVNTECRRYRYHARKIDAGMVLEQLNLQLSLDLDQVDHALVREFNRRIQP